MKRQLSSVFLLLTLATVGVSSVTGRAQAAEDTGRFEQAKECFMKLELSPAQKFRLLAIRTKWNLTAEQRLDEALAVLTQKQQQQYHQCTKLAAK